MLMMNKTILSFLLLLLLAACGGRKEGEESVAYCSSDTLLAREYVADFLQKYPLATLQDIYKGSFQDYFGAAHLLTDRQAVENYILREMEAMPPERKVSGYYEPCGWRGRYYRVDLALLQEGRIVMDEFVELFMESASAMEPALTQEWIDEWLMLQAAVREVAPRMEGFAADSLRIVTLLQEGKYVVHHSPSFNAHYHPHYRIIRRDLFEQNILPKIEKE